MGKKVVLDTNVLISAFGWEGVPHAIFEGIVAGKAELVTSAEQLAELERVLNYPKLGFTESQKQRFLLLLLEAAVVVEPVERVDAVREDPADNRILECAIAGRADFIVSGDGHLLGLKEFRAIRIVSPREFLRLLGSE